MDSSMNKKPISIEKSNGSGRGCMVAIGAIFAIFGLFFASLTTLIPFLESRSSDDWVETKCTVVSSKIDVNRDDDGTTYRPLVEFTYNYHGVDYRSDKFDFTSLNRSQSRCRQIVDDHVVGTRMGCFVNPNNPEEAVLVREYDFSYMGLIFPLIFAGLGFAIMLAALFFKNNKSNSISGSAKQPTSPALSSLTADGQPATSSAEHPADIEDQTWDRPKKLKPSQSRLVVFLVMLLFTLFWDGIVGATIYQQLRDFGKGPLGQGVDWAEFLFMTPFVLVGLFLLGFVFYLFVGLFNPTVEIALSTGAVRRGESVDVAWQLNGRTSSVRSLKITVEGEESATYRRGTSTITDKNVFCIIPVADTDSPGEIEFGSEVIPIPADTMHTFLADRNKIKWQVVVHGKIPYWPSVKETFEFRVKP